MPGNKAMLSVTNAAPSHWPSTGLHMLHARDIDPPLFECSLRLTPTGATDSVTHGPF